LFAALAALAAPLAAHGQTLISEDFTGTTTSNPWFFFADACLTASSAAGAQPSGSGNGQLPGCVAIQSTYNENLVGGYAQHGAIVSTTPFATGAGVSLT